MKIESVDLSFWTDEGENIEISLEKFQVKAIIAFLGMTVKAVPGEDNVFDTVMSGEKTVMKRLEKAMM